MLSFKQFIKEDTEPQTTPSEWENKTPRGMEEHDEVNFQLNDHKEGNVQWHPDVVQALEHLTKPENFRTALENSTKETRTAEEFKNNIGNHEVGKSSEELSKDLEPGKWKRAKEGNTPPGILLRVTNHETGETHEHALAGASNMAVTTARNKEQKTGLNTPVLVIDHSINKN